MYRHDRRRRWRPGSRRARAGVRPRPARRSTGRTSVTTSAVTGAPSLRSTVVTFPTYFASSEKGTSPRRCDTTSTATKSDGSRPDPAARRSPGRAQNGAAGGARLPHHGGRPRSRSPAARRRSTRASAPCAVRAAVPLATDEVVVDRRPSPRAPPSAAPATASAARPDPVSPDDGRSHCARPDSISCIASRPSCSRSSCAPPPLTGSDRHAPAVTDSARLMCARGSLKRQKRLQMGLLPPRARPSSRCRQDGRLSRKKASAGRWAGRRGSRTCP